MIYSFNKPPTYRFSGFTLLEMIVVLLLVSMLAGMLMQGFVYMSGVYGAVERRQKFAQSQRLMEGWLRSSVQGLVNGVDGEAGKGVGFDGGALFFRGITFAPLVGQNHLSEHKTRVAHKIEWRIKTTDTSLQLMYGEAPLTSDSWQWYPIREWPAGDASWRYWDGGAWLAGFSEQSATFGDKKGPRLPKGILLEVKGVRTPFSVFIALNSNVNSYRPPEIRGMF